MNKISQWDIWLADFPYEEDNSQSTLRPVIVLSVEQLWLLSVKVTKHNPRENDIYDIPITKWKESGLSQPSTARIAKTIGLQKNKFIKQLGSLHPNERINILSTFCDYVQSKKSFSAPAVNE